MPRLTERQIKNREKKEAERKAQAKADGAASLLITTAFPLFNDDGLVRLAKFIESTYELAFGDDAVNRDYSPQQVVDRLRTFSDQSHFLEETAAPMLKIIHQEGSEDWWEADLDETVEQLDNLGV